MNLEEIKALCIDLLNADEDLSAWQRANITRWITLAANLAYLQGNWDTQHDRFITPSIPDYHNNHKG